MQSFKKEEFGHYKNQEIDKITLTNDNGFQISIINLGAIIQSIKLPEGFAKRELTLGFNDLAGYLSPEYRENYPYFGAVIGRHSSRILNGETQINGKKISLKKNHAGHHLHGGEISFDSKVWKFENFDNSRVTLSLFSPDGDENYPGNLNVEVTYELNDENEITVSYSAKTDQPTIINLTQHTYFNLNQSCDSILKDEIKINAKRILEFNSDVVPTGGIMDVENTKFDFSMFKMIPAEIDNSFLVESDKKPVGVLRNEDQTIEMKVYTNQKILHIYSGFYIPELKPEGRRATQPNAGVCFETQGFLDAENHEKFPSNVLNSNDIYNHKTKFSFKF